MVAYGLGDLPLIEHLKEVFLGIHQYWYAEYASRDGCFNHIRGLWEGLSDQVPT